MQYLFKHLNVDYEYKVYETKYENGVIDNSEWTDVKFNLGMEFPNLPYIMDGDVKIAECTACYEYICAKWKPEYLGRDVEERGRVAMISGVAYGDMRNAIVFACYNGNSDRTPQHERIDKYMPGLYKFLGNNKFIVGN
jgi:glutathione S-transferase